MYGDNWGFSVGDGNSFGGGSATVAPMVSSGNGVGEWFEAGIEVNSFSEIVIALMVKGGVEMFGTMLPLDGYIEV